MQTPHEIPQQPTYLKIFEKSKIPAKSLISIVSYGKKVHDYSQKTDNLVEACLAAGLEAVAMAYCGKFGLVMFVANASPDLNLVEKVFQSKAQMYEINQNGNILFNAELNEAAEHARDMATAAKFAAPVQEGLRWTKEKIEGVSLFVAKGFTVLGSSLDKYHPDIEFFYDPAKVPSTVADEALAHLDTYLSTTPKVLPGTSHTTPPAPKPQKSSADSDFSAHHVKGLSDLNIKFAEVKRDADGVLKKLYQTDKSTSAGDKPQEEDENLSLPLGFVKSVEALAEGIHNIERILRRNRQFDAAQQAYIEEQKCLAQQFGVTLNIEALNVQRSWSDVYFSSWRMLHSAYAGQCADVSKICGDIQIQIEELQQGIKNKTASIQDYQAQINCLKTQHEKVLKKIGDIRLSSNGEFISIGLGLGASVAIAGGQPILAAALGIMSQISQMINERGQEGTDRKMKKYAARVNLYGQQMQAFMRLGDEKAQDIERGYRDIHELRRQRIQLALDNPPELRRALADGIAEDRGTIQRKKEDIERHDKSLAEATEKWGESGNRAIALENYLNDCRHNGTTPSITNLHKSGGLTEKDMRRFGKDDLSGRGSEHCLNVFLEELKDQAKNYDIIKDGIGIEKTRLGEEIVKLEKIISQDEATLAYENSMATVKDFGFRMNPPRALTTYDHAAIGYQKSWEALNRKTAAYGNVIHAMKGLGAALQRFDIQRPAQLMELVSSGFDIGKYIASFTFSNFRDGFYQWGKAGSTLTLVQAFEVTGCGMDAFLNEILSPTINIISLGVNIAAILIGARYDSPELQAMNEQFKGLNERLSQEFISLRQDIQDKHQHLLVQFELLHDMHNATDVKIKELTDTLLKRADETDKHVSKSTAKVIGKIGESEAKGHSTEVLERVQKIEVDHAKEEKPKVFLAAMKHAKDTSHNMLKPEPGLNIAESPRQYIAYLSQKFAKEPLVMNPELVYSAAHALIRSFERWQHEPNKTQRAEYTKKLSKRLPEVRKLLAFLSPDGSDMYQRVIVEIARSYQSLIGSYTTRADQKVEENKQKCEQSARNYQKTIAGKVHRGLVPLKAGAKTVFGFQKFLLNNLFCNELALSVGFKLDTMQRELGVNPSNEFFENVFQIVRLVSLAPYRVMQEDQRQELEEVFVRTKLRFSSRLGLLGTLRASKEHSARLGANKVKTRFSERFVSLIYSKKGRFELVSRWQKYPEEDKVPYRNYIPLHQYLEVQNRLDTLSPDYIAFFEENRETVAEVSASPIQIDFRTKWSIQNGVRSYSGIVSVNGHELSDNLFASVSTSHLREATRNMKVETSRDLRNKAFEITQDQSSYDTRVQERYDQYVNFLIGALKPEDYILNNVRLPWNEKSDSRIILPSNSQCTLPIVLPENYLKALEKNTPDLIEMYKKQDIGRGFVTQDYSFDKKADGSYVLSIHYALRIPPGIKNLEGIPHQEKSIEILCVDNATVQAFSDPHSKIVHMDEFLLTVLHGGKIADKKTVVLPGSDLVLPSETEFPGVYGILKRLANNPKDAAGYTVHFDHRNYDEQKRELIQGFIDGKYKGFDFFLKGRQFIPLKIHKIKEEGTSEQPSPKELPSFDKIIDYILYRSFQDDYIAQEDLKKHLDCVQEAYDCLVAMVRLMADYSVPEAQEKICRHFGLVSPKNIIDSCIDKNLLDIFQKLKEEHDKIIAFDEDKIPSFLKMLQLHPSDTLHKIRTICGCLEKWQKMFEGCEEGHPAVQMERVKLNSRLEEEKPEPEITSVTNGPHTIPPKPAPAPGLNGFGVFGNPNTPRQIISLAERAKNYGFKLCNPSILKDGNCFYHAVVHQLIYRKYQGKILDHMDLRKMAVSGVRAREDFYAKTLLQEETQGKNFQEVMKAHENQGDYATHMFILELARALEIDIYIIENRTEKQMVIPCGKTPAFFICLGLIVDGAHKHYESLELDGVKDAETLTRVKKVIEDEYRAEARREQEEQERLSGGRAKIS